MASRSDIQPQINYAQSQGWIPLFKRAADRWEIPLEVLLAVASRETKIGTDSYYRRNGYTGRDGHGKGIMQIDDRWHTFARLTPPNDHRAMIGYGAQFLADLRENLGSLRHALSAYNAGESSIKKALAAGIDPDLRTTGGDYAADVLQRAEIIRPMVRSASPVMGRIAGLIPPFLILSAGAGFIYQQLKQQRNSHG